MRNAEHEVKDSGKKKWILCCGILYFIFIVIT